MRKTASFRTWLENASLSHGDISTDDILVVFSSGVEFRHDYGEGRAIESLVDKHDKAYPTSQMFGRK